MRKNVFNLLVLQTCEMTMRIKLPNRYAYIAFKWDSRDSRPVYELAAKLREACENLGAEWSAIDIHDFIISWP